MNQLNHKSNTLTPAQAVRSIRAVVKLERHALRPDEIYRHILALCDRVKEEE